jgi:hypothetical protein
MLVLSNVFLIVCAGSERTGELDANGQSLTSSNGASGDSGGAPLAACLLLAVATSLFA